MKSLDSGEPQVLGNHSQKDCCCNQHGGQLSETLSKCFPGSGGHVLQVDA